MKVPQRVIDLISALAVHEMTTQLPHEIVDCDITQQRTVTV
ncbi:hypothetical protein SH528x_002075 [Novipirellula sp. SH528]